jgi:hypothetical protein
MEFEFLKITYAEKIKHPIIPPKTTYLNNPPPSSSSGNRGLSIT